MNRKAARIYGERVRASDSPKAHRRHTTEFRRSRRWPSPPPNDAFDGFVNVPRATFSGRFSGDHEWPLFGDHRLEIIDSTRGLDLEFGGQPLSFAFDDDAQLRPRLEAIVETDLLPDAERAELRRALSSGRSVLEPASRLRAPDEDDDDVV